MSSRIGYDSGFGTKSRRNGRNRLYNDIMVKIDSYSYLPDYDKRFVCSIITKKIGERISKNNGDSD
jgi:hypothetical protein